MTKCLVLILGCLLCVFSSTASNDVPTMAISCGNTPLVTLPKFQQSMNTVGFKKLLSSLWNEDTKVIVVLEDELSLEDYMVKDVDGHSLFKLFENTENRRFFPSVEQPEKVIEMLLKNGFSVKTYDDNIFVNVSEKMIALANLNENNPVDENRELMLMRHNKLVSKIFNNLCKQYTNVVLVFSGKINPWIEKSETSNDHHLLTRHLMGIDNIPPAKFKIADPKRKSLIYSASYPKLSINNGPFIQLEETVPDIFIDDSRESLLKVAKAFSVNGTKIILRFRFEKTTFTWELKAIEYESMGSNVFLLPQSLIGAQKGLSYFSEGPVIFSANSIVLRFNNEFQVSVFL